MSFLTGGSTPQVQFSPVGASGGGLDTKFKGGKYTTTADPTRTAAVAGVTDTYSDLGDLTGGLRGQVTPGYNALLDTQLSDINDQAHKAIGDLRTNLQSRRILGSSFGNDTLSRANAEVAKTRADVTARNFLQSLDANNKLLQQQYDAYTKAATTGLNELNLEAGVANGLIGGANQVLAQNAQVNAKLEAESQAGVGKFFGNILGNVGQSLFGPSLSSAGTAISGGLFGASKPLIYGPGN